MNFLDIYDIRTVQELLDHKDVKPLRFMLMCLTGVGVE